MWATHKPTFEYRRVFNDLDLPWSGHCLFGYDLVTNRKPKRIVELGSWKGTSLFSFAQAVKDMGLKTELHAVDTWTGDGHTGAYAQNVYEGVLSIRDGFYPEQNIVLHRMLFDDAVHLFEDGGIDLLHIDGMHTYDAVKHDFETWLPKCSKNAIILFHDTNERMKDFGVYRFWDELMLNYKGFEFMHSHGLGVLSLNGDLFEDCWEESGREHYYLDAYFHTKAELRAAKRIVRQYNDIKKSPLFRLMMTLRSMLGRT